MRPIVRSGSGALFLLLTVSCEGGEGIDFVGERCSLRAHELAHGEQSSIGLAGAEVVAWAEEAWRSVDVEWVGNVQPGNESFAFTFGAPVETREMSAEGLPSECSPGTWVEVTLPLEITSASGHLSAGGTAVLSGFYDDHQELRVYADWPDDEPAPISVVDGPYLQAAQAEDQGLEDVWLSLASRGWGLLEVPEQVIGVGGAWDLGSMGGKTASIYRCKVVGNSCFVPSDTP